MKELKQLINSQILILVNYIMNMFDKKYLDIWQVEQFHLIADLIRGDWSGEKFDGREVEKWILSTLEGGDIRNDLRKIQESY